MKPNLDYLQKVQRGEIVVRVERRPGKGLIWHATDGLALLRFHEEAGLVEPIYGTRRAGFSTAMQNEGVKARLTDEGRRTLEQKAQRQPSRDTKLMLK